MNRGKVGNVRQKQTNYLYHLTSGETGVFDDQRLCTFRHDVEPVSLSEAKCISFTSVSTFCSPGSHPYPLGSNGTRCSCHDENKHVAIVLLTGGSCNTCSGPDGKP